MNDEERRQWVENDEGLYGLRRSSGLSTREFVKRNRSLIDEVSGNVKTGTKPASYLTYHHGQGCPCFHCRRSA